MLFFGDRVWLHTLEFHVDTFFWHRQLSALGNLDGLLGLVAGVLLDVLNLFDNVVAFEDFAKDNVLAVQPAVESSLLLVYLAILCGWVREAEQWQKERTK